ncbi:recombinase family protein [Rubellimicrobium rubrum]|uniref:recombinase family protein n=1 Tax=Rubellimicrobium rubrum TaxID=2585369 RepID=UPI001C3F4830|nr:recombinase family protein [Rubellimicrobium rubrum]
MTLHGHADVSTGDQDLSVREGALRAAGRPVIRSEKKTGIQREGRAEFDILLQFLRPGDTLVITRTDRLARSLRDLQDIVHMLEAMGVTLEAAEQPVDTATAAGRAFFDMLAVFAEFETNLRRERQMEGIAAAKELGVYTGREPKIDPEEVRRLHIEEKRAPQPVPNGSASPVRRCTGACRTPIGMSRRIAPANTSRSRACGSSGPTPSGATWTAVPSDNLSAG